MAFTPADYEKNVARLAPMTPEQIAKHHEICRDAIARYRGSLDELESAIGMLTLGPHLGWKVLALVHSKKTLRKYEEILGISVREMFPEEGPSVERSLGYAIVRKLGNFWKVVSGDIKSEELKQVRRDVA